MTDYDDESEIAYYLWGPRERRVNRFFLFVAASVALTGCFLATRLLSDGTPLEIKKDNGKDYVQVLREDQEMRIEQKQEIKKNALRLDF